MTTNSHAGDPNWVDPDDAPELTEEWFESADQYDDGKLLRPGRPKLDTPKQQIALRLDADILERLRATGPGWQTRINTALRQWLDQNSPT